MNAGSQWVEPYELARSVVQLWLLWLWIWSWPQDLHGKGNDMHVSWRLFGGFGRHVAEIWFHKDDVSPPSVFKGGGLALFLRRYYRPSKKSPQQFIGRILLGLAIRCQYVSKRYQSRIGIRYGIRHGHELQAWYPCSIENKYIHYNITVLNVAGITTMLQIQGLYNTLTRGMKMDCLSAVYHLVQLSGH